jgi:hypothetical protein
MDEYKTERQLIVNYLADIYRILYFLTKGKGNGLIISKHTEHKKKIPEIFIIHIRSSILLEDLLRIIIVFGEGKNYTTQFEGEKERRKGEKSTSPYKFGDNIMMKFMNFLDIKITSKIHKIIALGKVIKDIIHFTLSHKKHAIPQIPILMLSEKNEIIRISFFIDGECYYISSTDAFYKSYSSHEMFICSMRNEKSNNIHKITEFFT